MASSECRVSFSCVPVVNAFFIENEVLPVIEFKLEKPISEPATAKNDVQQPVVTEIKPEASNEPEETSSGQSPHANVGEQDLYQLVGELCGLQQSLLEKIDITHSTSGATSENSAVLGNHFQTENSNHNGIIEKFDQSDITSIVQIKC